MGIRPLPLGIMHSAAFRRILLVVEETKAVALENKRELEFIKQLLVPQTLDFSDTLQCMSRPAETAEELQEFCLKLDDKPFRKNVVIVLYSTGGPDIECHCRRMLDKLMSTKLMLKFNFSGKGQKGKQAFIQLPQLVAVMQDALRKSFKHERDIFDKFKRGVSEYLKGAPKRVKRVDNSLVSHQSQINGRSAINDRRSGGSHRSTNHETGRVIGSGGGHHSTSRSGGHSSRNRDTHRSGPNGSRVSQKHGH